MTTMNPLRIVGRFPRPVRLLLVGTLVNKLGTFVLPYLALVLLRDFHMREGEAARLLFAYGAGSLVSVLAGGVLTDGLGRRRTLLVSLFGSGALAVGMGLSPSARFFVPLLVAFGFIGDLYRPAAAAVISDLLPSSERASGFAGLRMAVNLGWAVGTALGGLLADWDWRLLFLGDGLTTLAYGVLVFFAIPETRVGAFAPAIASTASAGAPHVGASEPGSDAGAAPMATDRLASADVPLRSFRDTGHENPLLDGVYLQMVGSAFLFTLIFCSNLSVMPLTVTRTAGYPAVVYGMLAAVNGLLIALFEISIVARLRRYRRLRLACLYQASWSIAFAVNPALALPLHAALGERAFWGLMPLVAIPAVVALVRLDRIADRPERLRGLSAAPASSA